VVVVVFGWLFAEVGFGEAIVVALRVLTAVEVADDAAGGMAPGRRAVGCMTRVHRLVRILKSVVRIKGSTKAEDNWGGAQCLVVL